MEFGWDFFILNLGSLSKEKYITIVINNQNSLGYKMNTLVHGIGINDLPNTLDEDGKQCVIYTKWKDMLRRAYSTQVNDLRKNPTYSETTVCDEL